MEYFTSKRPHFHESKVSENTSEMTPHFILTSVINCLLQYLSHFYEP